MSEADNGLKLYVTTNSPFARLARIVVLEKGLESRVEQIIAKTRQANSPYYQVNPSGRVPCLVLPDGRRLEDSQLVCHYLDHLDAAPRFEPPAGDAGLEVRRLEGLARSLVEGVSVWIREGFRPPDDRSPGAEPPDDTRQVLPVRHFDSKSYCRIPVVAGVNRYTVDIGFFFGHQRCQLGQNTPAIEHFQPDVRLEFAFDLV